ncbi:ATP-binding cassette domain-containing protein [Phaeobacter gallaeciensis]|uniref:ABC-type nitrate/sulfonate/bicarbonate transport system, ATPase component n=1 Tax=Phaeobacter gallaeciensis TaxID=60890 RepID=A0AAC9ZD39_9RHOB|nr:ATP-binding cassette domain-containing protein [Phaeobacter gallaeciensis]AHD11620.1 ABC-type nitrate/sulfonate/bicarbonate transport system, ATPase component [Phaeobacter gallaeciensis DSM 26640]ATE94884.1 ABC-type nitrate/sulfonate/bicarbonate transport system, ATPase component [Phaeobacter gallaeciensis]ATE99155.1 ABC-type nitrate/sulfonate/bicarbonate transport system, ATPase component [Phaeobacter gallaeciensis]ATF03548.1 ABC-type nitrate/sulfonate/bicarbonate transport system, ATPase c
MRPQAAIEDIVLDLDLRRLILQGKPILHGIRLRLRRSETLALVGPSGIGKTSLLRVISGINTNFDGQRKLNGTCAVVFQEPRLLPWINALCNICFTTGVSPDHARKAMSEVGLSGREADFPDQLSLGQQRRLALARAFAAKPNLLLLDEPFVSLDPALAEEMMSLFAQMRDRHHTTTILVSHAEAEAQRLADRIVTLAGNPASLVPQV